jgi:hypothetical protein
MWPAASPPTRTEIRLAFGVDVAELQPQPGGFEVDAFADGHCGARRSRRLDADLAQARRCS